MKTLLILRHGKSSWDHPGLSDHDRPLKKRGLRDAPRIGLLLQSQALVPDLIITSSAVRARQTAELVAAYCGCADAVVERPDLYPGTAPAYQQALNTIDDAHARVLLVAHNPGLEALLQQLAGGHEPLPTAALAWLTLPITRWSQLALDTHASLERLWRPKEMEARPSR